MKIMPTVQEKIMNKKVVRQIVLVVLVLGAGFGFFKLLASMRKSPERGVQQAVVPLLNARVVKSENIQVIIPGFGTVQPKVEVTVIPQVSGKIIDCHEGFVNGGFFKAGEPLIVIEPDDYKLAVESADAVVKQAEVAYERELAEQKVARQEWEQIHPDEEPNSPLVTRDLQVKFALADFKSAQAKLSNAKLDLERTTIKMPFSGRVSAESVDIGQYIPAGQPIATVYSTDAVEIAVPLSDTQLAWFDVPGGYNHGPNSVDGDGAMVEVTAEFAGGTHCWSGQVVRTRGQIDPISRMVHVVVEVNDPFKPLKSRPPLVPGMFVEVDIQGRKIDKAIRVPRYAIRNGSDVWVEEEGELKIVDVEIVRMDREHAYIASGLSDGDVVIVSPLDIVTDGMKIKTNILGPN
jgi:RND family efflux transporter MFP subunit